MKRLKQSIALRAVLVLAACMAGSSAGASAQDKDGGQALQLSPCHIPQHPQEALCGTHTVYENRAAGEGRQIDIQLAVIPAVDETSEPDPLVFFAGGPGQAAMDMAPIVRRMFREVNESRDVVLINQRGMGTSHPLECELPEDEPLMMGPEERERLTKEMLTECLANLDADVTLYTQDVANQDANEILLALGYDRINLYGVSWGTRSAILYAHQFPEHVRTLVLDGNLPLQNAAPLHAAADAERAMTKLLEDCAADAHCGEAFPELRQNLEQVMAHLGTEGQSITIADPLTGESQTLLLTQGMFGDVLRTILYSADLSRMGPMLIRQAADGDYRGVMGVTSALNESVGGGMTLGAMLTIFCSEELARMTDTELEEELAERLLGHQMIDNFKIACEVWPKAPTPAIYSEAVSSEAPALILSGDVDPITPPHWGDVMKQALPNSLHLVAPATGHNVAPQGCAPDLIHQVIDQGNLDGVNGECLQEIKRPSFFINASGPNVTKVAKVTRADDASPATDSDAASEPSSDSAGDDPAGGPEGDTQ